MGLSGRQQNADVADTLHLRDVAMATTSCLSVGYNFGGMIASDTFDSRGGFSGSSYPMKTFRGSKAYCHGNHFWISIYGVHIGAT